MKKILLILLSITILFLSFLFYSGGDNTDNNNLIDERLLFAIQKSDDYITYQSVFLSLSSKLITNGICTIEDFQEWGGWMRSTNKGPRYYFTYCGGPNLDNRIYINVLTNEYSH